MAANQNRKRDPCTSYKREGRTKQSFLECLPFSRYRAGCEEKVCKGAARVNQDVYECCPPTPLELRCSVCYTAERDSCNLWTCVPFVSYSVLWGPTFADLVIHLLNLLPISILACLGIAHPRCCKVKTKPFIKNCPPRCVPVNRCADKHESKKPYHYTATKIGCGTAYDGGDASSNVILDDSIFHSLECLVHIESSLRDSTELDVKIQIVFVKRAISEKDEIYVWMHDEYDSLARELAEIKRLTTEDDNDTDNERDLLQARNYVLDRLAEMLAKREEIERRMEKKKQNR